MSKQYKLIFMDEVWTKIVGLTKEDGQRLSNAMSYKIENYFHNPKVKEGHWDGKIRFVHYDGPDFKVYTRLLDEVVFNLEMLGYTDYVVSDRRKPAKLPPEDFKVTEDIIPNAEINGKPFRLRPYQVEDIQKLVDAGGGMAILGTGYGKTSLTAVLSYIYTNLGHKTITVVPSVDLVEQTASWYRKLGFDVGIFCGDQKDTEQMHIVSTWQSLQNSGKILSLFNCIIWDEAHSARADVAKELLTEAGINIQFRFGVTGTFPKYILDQKNIIASIGSVVAERPASWLIENGYLSRVDIQPVMLEESLDGIESGKTTNKKLREIFPDYKTEKTFINRNPKRLSKIADIVISIAAQQGNTLVLVNSIEFGKKLAKLIKGAVFLHGDTDTDIREEHYKMFEEQNDLIVIASSGIASTGISIDRIFGLVFIDAGKSFIKAIQSVGRGLRKSEDKDYVVVYDIFSNLEWAKKHFKQRKKHYEEAQYPLLSAMKVKVG